MAVHTGQSSQLFPVATDRNAQFLTTVAELDDRERWQSYATIRTLSDELFRWAAPKQTVTTDPRYKICGRMPPFLTV
jgi:hypothetical protein